MLKTSELERIAGELATKIHNIYSSNKNALQAQFTYDMVLATLKEVNEDSCGNETE